MITDVALCAQSAAAYDQTTTCVRLHWQDMSALLTGNATDGFVLAIEGTNPENLFNLIRDARISAFPMKDHPQLGPMPVGAADAADGFFDLVQSTIGDAPWCATGHSLGGQVAVGVAALMRLIGKPPQRLVPFDPPKSGGPTLAAILSDVPGTVYAFNGSVVSHWPFFECQQFREPTVIGDYTVDVLEAHSISRALAWMQTHPILA